MGLKPYEVPAGVVDSAAWKILREQIWKNAVNRAHRLSDHEIRCMPWIVQMRPPNSWPEFAVGVITAMSELGYVYQRQYKLAYLTAKSFGGLIKESAWGRVYRVPGWPELHLCKLGSGRMRYATWVTAPATVPLATVTR